VVRKVGTGRCSSNVKVSIMRKLLITIMSAMGFAGGVIGCQCCNTGRQPLLSPVTSQSSVTTQRIARGMKMSVARSRVRSVGGSPFMKVWPIWAFGHSGGPSKPPPKLTHQSIFYRLPGDTVIWLLASKPRDESDDTYVLEIIGLTEKGKADEFEQSGSSPRKLIKYRPKALTISKEGLVEIVSQEKKPQN